VNVRPLHPKASVRPSPVFLAIVALTAVGGALAWISAAELREPLAYAGVFIFVIAGWIVSLSLHEFGHAFTAWRFGDHDVAVRGYLTLNPFKYTHPVLSILLPLVAIVGGGFALPGGAVYLHPHSFRTRAQRSWAAAAGPLTNVAFAIVLVVIAKSHLTSVSVTGGDYTGHARFWGAVAFLGLLQVTAAVLNLLPIPGLDGWAIIEPYLRPQTVQLGEKIKPWGLFAVILLLFYADPLKNAFFDLVDAIYGAFGGNDFMHYFGYNLFRFWAKDRL
jgi:Zn-dependent protease